MNDDKNILGGWWEVTSDKTLKSGSSQQENSISAAIPNSVCALLSEPLAPQGVRTSPNIITEF